jgi:putative toxin-antitoxin system antitoxin component (TIGR02293 family)
VQIKNNPAKGSKRVNKSKSSDSKKASPAGYAGKSNPLPEAEENAYLVNDGGLAYATTAVLQKRAYNSIARNLAGRVQALTDMLQGPKKQEPAITVYEKIDMINQGISKKELEYLKQKSGLDYDQLAEVFSVARATLINKKGSEKFNQSLSEKIVSLADIYSYGYEVFEDEGRFNTWVFRPNQSLGGKTPYAFLNTQYGREEIRNLIGRIDYGVYA